MLDYRSDRCTVGIVLTVLFMLLLLPCVCPAAVGESRLRETVTALSELGDRSTGTPGAAVAADYIKDRFTELGFGEVGSFGFTVPVLKHGGSTLEVEDSGKKISLSPMAANVISPGAVAPSGISGPLLYVGKGDLSDFNGMEIEGAVVLMEFASGGNWRHAAALGARALIYVDRGAGGKFSFEEKVELTPMDFPRFWMTAERAEGLFGVLKRGRVASRVSLSSEVRWESAGADNVYCLVPGRDKELSSKLIMVEAFYDSTAYVSGSSPGADEAVGIATLLELAAFLKENPPERSVLLVATAGNAQSKAGMREVIWSLKASAREMKKTGRALKKTISKAKSAVKNLPKILSGTLDGEAFKPVQGAVSQRIKEEVDRISRELMRLRLTGKTERIPALTQRRLLLRRLDWRRDYTDLSGEEKALLAELVPLAVAERKTVLDQAKRQMKRLKKARGFRSLINVDYELTVCFSLHLSSRGQGVGAFNKGWLYPLKPGINRVGPYGLLDEAMRDAARRIEGGDRLFRDTLRPSRLRSWESWLPDKPRLGGEVSAMAGYLGVSLATVHDGRLLWGTPRDLPASVNLENAAAQSDFVARLIGELAGERELHGGDLPRNGFSNITGKASLLRHGELFAEAPAPGTVVLAYQGPAMYHAVVDAMGVFRLKGVASKKLVLHKVILEGYRFDDQSGAAVWAIDKKQTGKPAYRLKIRRSRMKTDLVMFSCRQTTLYNVIEPRSFKYMTKMNLIDGRREASPVRYWYSRIDTRASLVSSIFLPPGTPLKLTLSDSILKKKMILTNADEEHPTGTGYRVDDFPSLRHTEYKTARDMWALLAPRIRNLEDHGIHDLRINGLMTQGEGALAAAKSALAEFRYDAFFEHAASSWALAARVYDHVDATQKDVLFGVLFYIALFVPFAFCMERLLFCCADIHRRILAFTGILLALIFVIYKVHPAFKLAYSPTVVILAFFIMGLSFMVTMIIFLRFEEEMNRLQRRSMHLRAEEISGWKAFFASLLLGVSNLRRRRLRSALTCTTLVILTFTVMSFTSVKGTRSQSSLAFDSSAPYTGLLFKRANWMDLPADAFSIIRNSFEKGVVAAPRVWLEEENRTRPVAFPVRAEKGSFEARGVMGFSHEEPLVTGFDRILERGRWLREGEAAAVLLPDQEARRLGVVPGESEVLVWGAPFRVVGTFSGKKLMALKDLDGESPTPVTFPSEAAMEMTEVELEAVESGDDVRAFQSRYQHVGGDQAVILPYETLLAAGGHLKGVAVKPPPGTDLDKTARGLADRFGITLFSGGKKGTFLHTASDTMDYSGLPNIVIPILISVFIVLNTMIGSVYERKKEIGIYTSVGLAPTHVSFIFIAEAVAFGVISVVLGYLLAQVSAGLFAGTPLWAGITVNYSSMAGVIAMVLVLVVVLVSVIYPSKVAARIAIPDVNRSWTLPDARGGLLTVTLPFLMDRREVKSAGGYLMAYFEGHRDVSHGSFSTGEVTMMAHPFGEEGSEVPLPGKVFHLRMKVWLAPFDFGIMQEVNLALTPAGDGDGFWEVNMDLRRESGEANAWHRINKVFLREVRKQLMVWRSLDTEGRRHFMDTVG